MLLDTRPVQRAGASLVGTTDSALTFPDYRGDEDINFHHATVRAEIEHDGGGHRKSSTETFGLT